MAKKRLTGWNCAMPGRQFQMTKTLLIISGGSESADITDRAHQDGHTVIVSDADPQAPAFSRADSCLIADIYGASETAAAAERYNRKIRKIDGVVCAAATALTAATVTERLRLPGLPLHVAELMDDRLAIRRCFASAGIATPWHTEIFTPQELQRIVIAKGRALLLKPVENHGTTGVQNLEAVEDLHAAFGQARGCSPSERVMVEQVLAGPTISVDCLMLQGSCHVAGTAQSAAAEAAKRTASALGIYDGPLSCEIVMHQGAAHVTDVSTRLSPANFVVGAIRLALGEQVLPQDLVQK